MNNQIATEVYNKQARRWCFTWNNYPTDIQPNGCQRAENVLRMLRAQYLIVGAEIAPNTGTPHLQGYCEFSSGKRLDVLKKVDGGERIHWEAAKGDQASNITYCSKGGNTFTYGDPKEQGKRTDLNDVRSLLDGGSSMLTVAQHDFTSFVRYNRGFEKYQYLIEQQNAKEMRLNLNVEVRWGPTGTGKTRMSVEEGLRDYGDYYITSEGNTGLWWTGYAGQRFVIIDDFRCTVPLHIMLRWLDIYPVQVPVHGGYVHLRALTIIITSNVDPQNWYGSCESASRQALLRRLKTIKNIVATEVAGGNTEPPPLILNSFSPCDENALRA